RELVQQIVATTRGKTHVKLSDLQPFADTHPQCTALLGALSKLELERGHTAKAGQWYHRLLKIKPAVAEGWINRGIARSMHNDFQGAVREFEQAAKLEPNNPEIFELRGDACLEVNDYQSAIESFRRLSKLAPDSSTGFRRSGDSYRLKGDRSGA